MSGSTQSQDATVATADLAATPGAACNVWEYLVEHIDQFEVAQSVVQHFDAHPGHLDQVDITKGDMIGLVLRAKVTLKREQVAYMRTQAALKKAQESSRGFGDALVRARAVARTLLCSWSPTAAFLALGLCMVAVRWWR